MPRQYTCISGDGHIDLNPDIWRDRVQALVPRYNQERGRWARVSRDDLARTTRRASDGRPRGSRGSPCRCRTSRSRTDRPRPESRT